jgi:hypothetical protein
MPGAIDEKMEGAHLNSNKLIARWNSNLNFQAIKKVSAYFIA